MNYWHVTYNTCSYASLLHVNKPWKFKFVLFFPPIYSPTSSITVAVTLPTGLLAEQVYNPLSLNVALFISHVFPLGNVWTLMTFLWYHSTEGGGFPSTGQVRVAEFPRKTEIVLSLSVTCGESKRKEQAGYFCQKIINTCTKRSLIWL